MVNDLSMTVRREATGLLGSLHLVSQKFLEQTLDKKLMSHLKASHSDQWTHFTYLENFQLSVDKSKLKKLQLPLKRRLSSSVNY